MTRSSTIIARAAARGFTVLELMIVLVIIGILAGIVGLNLIGAAEKAKISATQTSMKTIQAALKMYRVENNAYPPTNSGLAVLVGRYGQLTSIPKDSWGHEFEYWSPTQLAEYELYSAGPDGQFQTPDDIRMVPEETGLTQP